jgi:hypothetical protein
MKLSGITAHETLLAHACTQYQAAIVELSEWSTMAAPVFDTAKGWQEASRRGAARPAPPIEIGLLGIGQPLLRGLSIVVPEPGERTRLLVVPLDIEDCSQRVLQYAAFRIVSPLLTQRWPADSR